jgi:hypothetical protein
VTEVGLRVIPLGAAVPSCLSSAKVTVPVNPFCGVRVRVVPPDCPCWTVREVGFRERVKVDGAPMFGQAVRSRARPTSTA